MTRIVLIHAGPTQWDVDGRLAGNHPLPLTTLGHATIAGIVQSLTHPVTAVYCFKKNEACEQAARIVATQFKLRVQDSVALDEVNLGLWQGLTITELRARHPTAFGQWEEDPLAVRPPQGETLDEAIARLRAGLRKILMRKRGVTIVLPLRPLSMQITRGLLLREAPAAVAGHLHQVSAVETIEIANDQLQQFIS